MGMMKSQYEASQRPVQRQWTSRTLEQIDLDIEQGVDWPWMLSRQQFDCPYANFVLLNETSGEVVNFDCRSWKCSVHSPRQLWRWTTRMSMVPWSLFLTLTLVPPDRAEAAKAWTAYIRCLKRDFRVDTYLRVLELGNEGGMRHYHVLLHGADFIKADSLRQLSEAVGFGRRTNIKAIKDKTGAIHYVTKTLRYVLKEMGLDDPRLRGWRRVTCSRNLPSWPTVASRLNPLDPRTVDPDAHWILTRKMGLRSSYGSSSET